MYIIIIEILWIQIVLLGRKPSKALLIQIGLQRIKTSNNNIYSKIKLKLLQQQWVLYIPTNHHRF